MFGEKLARQPDCPSSNGVAQGYVLIPVSIDGVGADVGGVEQNEEKSEMSRRGL